MKGNKYNSSVSSPFPSPLIAGAGGEAATEGKRINGRRKASYLRGAGWPADAGQA